MTSDKKRDLKITEEQARYLIKALYSFASESYLGIAKPDDLRTRDKAYRDGRVILEEIISLFPELANI